MCAVKNMRLPRHRRQQHFPVLSLSAAVRFRPIIILEHGVKHFRNLVYSLQAKIRAVHS